MDQHIAEAARDDLKRLRRAKRRRERPERGQVSIFVGYVWSEEHSYWLLLGFTKLRGSLKPKRVEKLRKRFTIPDGACFRLIELFVAQATGPGSNPHPIHLANAEHARTREAPNATALQKVS